MKAIVSAENKASRADRSAVSLVFAPGARPDVSAIGALAARNGKFSVSFAPDEISSGENHWVELLANGLTFDVTGLKPGPARGQPERAHLFGLPEGPEFAACEAITITPGSHLAGGRTMLPVLRNLALLGALFAELPQVFAVAWHPARAWSEPGYFRSAILRWIAGGPFPGLGLTAIAPTSEGGLKSEGLEIFTGQELVLSPDLVRDGAEGAKVAVRLVNWLAESGMLTESTSMMGHSGETLHLVPQQNQQIVKVTQSS
ncbi:MAG: hypothetical protein B7Y88_10475 [Sphingomonadales bacterium 32-64-17]|nr:MAG: hypothetical protein B7Y88_10475 [Sphingomonadales bacterium 32-64-17]